MVTKEERDNFYASQKRYAEGYEKTVKPQYETAERFMAASVEYGKLTISSLILVNGGGLAGLLAIQPLVRDLNQTWLIQGTWVAALFAGGLLFAISSAAISYVNFALNAQATWARAAAEESVLKGWHFAQVDQQKADQVAAKNQEIRDKALRRSGWAYTIALTTALISALAGAAGGAMLAWRLLTLTLI